MTLDVAKFISNSIRKQAKISHLDISTKTTTVKGIPSSVTKLIEDEYGEKYLLDADYVSFFWGGLSKENIDKLFRVVDNALGKSANKLTETDFKKIKLDSNDTEEVEIEDEVEEEVMDDSEEEDSEEDVEDEVEDIVDDDNDEEEDKKEIEDEIEEKLNEDDSSDKAPISTAYFFLKITMK